MKIERNIYNYLEKHVRSISFANNFSITINIFP